MNLIECKKREANHCWARSRPKHLNITPELNQIKPVRSLFPNRTRLNWTGFPRVSRPSCQNAAVTDREREILPGWGDRKRRSNARDCLHTVKSLGSITSAWTDSPHARGVNPLVFLTLVMLPKFTGWKPVPLRQRRRFTRLQSCTGNGTPP